MGNNVSSPRAQGRVFVAALTSGGFRANKTAYTHNKQIWGGDFTAALAADPQRAVAETASKDGCRGRGPGCFG